MISRCCGKVFGAVFPLLSGGVRAALILYLAPKAAVSTILLKQYRAT
jgi:hypothetical protein